MVAWKQAGWLAVAAVVAFGQVAHAQDYGDDYGDESIGQWESNSGGYQPPAPVAPSAIAESPGAQVDFDSFYNSLAPYGEWLDLPAFGWVFRPYASVVGPDFRPYVSYGRWVYTPYGWSFVSGLPFGWACFHYGRWALDATYGWVWVPGFVWAPAWVDWRWGGGYVGWAPLPPPGWTAAWYGPYWAFVQVNVFDEPDVGVYVVPRERVRYVYTDTRPVETYVRYRGYAYNPGPQPVRVERYTHRVIRPVPVATGRARPVPVVPQRFVPVWHGEARPVPTRPPNFPRNRGVERYHPGYPRPVPSRRPGAVERVPAPAFPAPERRPGPRPAYQPPPRRAAPAPQFRRYNPPPRFSQPIRVAPQQRRNDRRNEHGNAPPPRRRAPRPRPERR